MKNKFIISCLIMLVPLLGFSQFQLNTVPPLNGGNGQNGITFNVVAKQNIIIDTLFVSFTGTGTAEVWYNPNPITAAPTINAANGWVQLVSNAPITTAVGAGNIQAVPANIGLVIPAGSTYGMYVGGPSLAYTNGTTTFSDQNMDIQCGGTAGYGGPAPNPTFNPRQFNGGIKYTVSGGMNDAAVLSIDSPGVYCSGPQSVVATIGNYGGNQINSVTVNWEVNGVLQTPFNFTGLLDTLNGANPQSAQINLGTFTFPSGANSLRVYTSNPNGVADTSNLNDTLTRITGPSFVGALTVDPNQAVGLSNFHTLGGAVNALTALGMCGPVTIDIVSGTFNENVTIGAINGMSSINTLTISGVDSASTIIDASAGYAGIGLEGASYVTIEDLGVIHNSTTSGMPIVFGNGSHHNVVQNCSIKADVTSTAFQVRTIGTSASLTTGSNNSTAHHNTVQDCRIIGGYYGPYFYGGSGNNQSNNRVLRNEIDSVYYYGVYGYYQDSMEVTGNNVNVTNRGNINADGFYGLYNTNGMFKSNTILAEDYGFYISNSSTLASPTSRKIEISNNMIISESDYGMYLYSVDSVNIWYNTIVTSGTFNPALQIAINTTYPISDYDVRNNIFYSDATEALEILTTTDSIFVKFDNNVYYTASGANLFRITNVNYVDLVAYQTAQPLFNSSSLEGDPQFNSLNNLRIVGSFINDAGDPTVPVFTDIDGDVRPSAISTNTDPGADEYDPPTCAPPISMGSRNIGSFDATIFWMSGGASGSFEYEVVNSGSAQGSGTTVATTVDTALITGLSAYTVYEFYVREVCGRGDTSPWVGPISFRTLCAPFTAPYYTGFETDPIDQVPGCWNEFKTPYATAHNVWVRNFVGVNGPYQGSNAMYIYPQSGFTNGVDTLMAISPQFTDMSMGNKQVRFWTSADVLACELYVGTTNDPFGFGTVTYLDTIYYNAIDVYQEAIVPITTLNGYNGTDQYVVLAHNLIGTQVNFDYIRVDEFNYEDMPSCPKPQGLGIANLTANSADLVWNSPSGGSNFEVEWDTAGFTIGTGNMSSVTGTSLSISGLSPATAYEFYVREICAAGDTSVWNGPFAFNSLIQGPLGVNCVTGNASSVLVEEFDNLNNWTGNIGTGTQVDNWNVISNRTGSTGTGPNGPHSGNSYIYVETSGGAAGTIVSIVSNPIDLTAVTDSAEASFWMHAFGPNIGTLNFNVGTSATGPFTTLFSWTGELQTAETDPFQQVGVRLDAYVGQTIYVEFEYIRGASFTSDIAVDLFEINGCVSCAAPSNLVDSNLTAFTVDLGWVQNGAVPSWEIEYGPAGFTPGTGTMQTVTSLPVSLSGLTQATAYDWYVRTICAPGDTSIWVSSMFETPCAPYTAPYFIDFEAGNINETPNCWTEYKTAYATGHNVWTRNFTGVNGPCFGNQAMYIYPQSGFTPGSDTLAAISPKFSDMTMADKRVRFWASTDDISVNLIVGTTSNPNGTGSVTNLDTLVFNAVDVCQEFIVNLDVANGYNGTDTYVFLAHSLASTVQNFDYIRVDNFRYEDIPSCVRPSNLSASNSTLTSVDLDWIENNSATTWEIEYDPAGFTPGSGTRAIVTSKPHTLSGLMPSTTYEIYVRSICTAGDTSFWEGPLLFSTANGIPYNEPFTGYATGIIRNLSQGGWTAVNTAPVWEVEDASGANENSTGTGPFFDNTTFGTAGGNYVYLETSSGFGNEDTLRSPSILIPANPGPLDFSFFYHMYGAAMGDLEVYIDSAGTLIGMDTLSGQIQTAGGDAWIGDTIPMPGGLGGMNINIVFVGRSVSTYTSDMSIDDIRIDFAISVDEITETINGLSIYPNPSSNGLFNLSLEDRSNEAFRLSARDLSGKLVYEELVTLNGVTRKQIDLSGLAKGVYTLQVQSGDQSKVEKLIIK